MQIEKNVPLRAGRGQPRKYPWAELHIGDSFAAPVHPKVLRASSYRYDKQYGTKIIVRKDIDGARAWRIK